jgi:UDP-N-acetylmuramoyl-tripeptide--D-alanyl-D-alanine ligase
LKLHAEHVALDLQSLGVRSRLGAANLVFDGVCTDSRAALEGRLFVALRGERFDGHDFVEAAVEHGARGVLVASSTWERWRTLGAACFAVEDPLGGLQQLARASLVRHRSTVVAITGSNGKTTTKDLARAAVAHLGAVWGTHGNLNNHIGVPLTVLQRRGDEPHGVVEVGANDFGEVELLSRLLGPRLAVVTNIGRAHLERFGSVEGVVRAKSELFSGVVEGGVAVLPGDDAWLETLRRAAEAVCARTVTFGFDAGCEYRLEVVESNGPDGQTLLVNGTRIRVRRPGPANARNAACAFAIARELGVAPDAAAAGIAACAFARQRSAWQRVGDVLVLDDSYNANPDSMLQALALLCEHEGRRIAVLGDMLELGSASEALHAELGEHAVAAGVSLLLATGDGMRHAVQAASAAGLAGAARHFEAFDRLVAALRDALRPGDAVLVKGSRGSRMERVVEALHAGVM